MIRDVIARRCLPYDFIGPPSKVTTVDKFQGQQNDFILLSLVRTRFVGHLRDVRRLVVAMSRARLGLYVFCRRSLFEQCYELQPTFQHLLQRPDLLALNMTEAIQFTDRHVEETGPIHLVSGIEEMESIVNYKIYQAQMMSNHFLAYSGQVAPPMGAAKQNGLPILGPQHISDSMDAGLLSLANGSPEDVQPVGRLDDTPQIQTLANQTGDDFPLEGHSNEEANMEVETDDKNGVAHESCSNEDSKAEE